VRCFAPAYLVIILLGVGISACSATRRALALDPLPAATPEVAAPPGQSIEQLAAHLAAIEAPSKRCESVVRAWYVLRTLNRQELIPLISLFEREVAGLEDKNWVVAIAEQLSACDPEQLRLLTRQVPMASTRDYCWRIYAVRIAREDAARAREAIVEIENPDRRVDALIGYMGYATLTIAEIDSAVQQIERLGWPMFHSPPMCTLGTALGRLPPEQFEPAIDYLRAKRNPDDAVLALGYMADHLRYFEKRSKDSERALRAAVELIDSCADCGTATKAVLQHGFAKIDRERASELFDEHAISLIRRKPDEWGLIGYVVPDDVSLALDRLRKVAIEIELPEDRYDRMAAGVAAAVLLGLSREEFSARRVV
jgi:hypothetical protein